MTGGPRRRPRSRVGERHRGFGTGIGIGGLVAGMGLVVLTTACSGAPADRAGPSVSDSSGVTIIRHAQAGGEVEANPSVAVVLGTGTETLDRLFRVRGGVLLDDGRIAVANSGSAELIYFEPDGRPHAEVGRRGEGPGEFANLFQLQGMPGSEVVAFDPQNTRISWVDAGGGFRTSVRLDFESEVVDVTRAIVGRGYSLGVTVDGDVVTVPWARATYGGVEGDLPLRGEVRRYVPDLSAYTVLDSVTLRSWYEQPQAEGPPIAQVFGSPLMVHGANRDWIAYSEATSHRIEVLSKGALDHVIIEARARRVFEVDSIPAGFHHAADSMPAYTDLAVVSAAPRTPACSSASRPPACAWSATATRTRRSPPWNWS